MYNWKRDVVTWKMNGITYISVPFTWFIKKAIQIANKEKGKVIIGGPAVMLQRETVEAAINKNVKILDEIPGIEPITLHNPFATFTTRGCVAKCKFCAVPLIEGSFREITDFIPRPIVCDNNFLASSRRHFYQAIDKLKKMPMVDFNQSLDATLFTPERADKLTELKIPVLRFSFDTIKKETQVVDAIRLARSKGFKQITFCLLYGFNQTVEESVYMGEVLRREKVNMYPMRYNPIDATIRNSYINTEKGWTANLLSAFQRCFLKTNIPFEEFTNQVNYIEEEEGFFDM